VTTDPVDTSLVVRIKVGHQPRYMLAFLWVGLVLLALIFSSPDSTLLGYFLVALLGCVAALLAFLVLPQFNFLELQRTRLIVRQFRVTNSYRWHDVEKIEVLAWQKREVIGLNLSPQVAVKDRAQNREKRGFDLLLLSHYELAPQEIVDMMNAYRLG
jgi:hypothetical protein